MNNLTNSHSHCDFCDGHAPMELFVREAVKEGFSSYGVSSHAPFPVQNGCNMQKEKMTAYLEEFRRLKQLYSSEIDLYIGLEIDFLDDSFNPSIDYFQSLPLDYRIGSVHYIVVEVNTKAWETRGRFYPNYDYFELMNDLGIRVVVNSDAHYPEKINAGRIEALRALAQAGYTNVWQFCKGNWVDVPVEY